MKLSTHAGKSSFTHARYPFLKALGIGEVNSGVFTGERWTHGNGEEHVAVNPSTGEAICKVKWGNAQDYEECAKNMMAAKRAWADTPMPVRGDAVRRIGNALRERKAELGQLLALEMGKIRVEGEGEVQEFIDVCDMAAGLSRQLPGQVLPSERAGHVMLESWHPLGALGIITAFNFPHAVFGWNAAISLVCGNVQIVKGAETASLSTIATQRIVADSLQASGVDPRVAVLCQGRGRGGPGELMCNDERVDLVSFTGSTRAGLQIGQAVGKRFGRSILELGGNNAVIVMPDADLEMAVRSVMFAAVGTCGQRCTSLRRLILHQDVYDGFLARLVKAYDKVHIGDPLDPATLCGPLHTKQAVDVYRDTLRDVRAQGGNVVCGDGVPKLKDARLKGGNFVLPTLVEMSHDAKVVHEERFVPVCHVIKAKSLDEAIRMNNSVKQGLTASLFTRDMRHVFEWIGPHGSDTGIANVNTSCSGAEIGGAFGGNKATGGGRESGSDAWKQYMRRGTHVVNYSNALPLAQGIVF